MPLRDHFRPPMSVERPWDGIYSAWATTIATTLNRDHLPDGYCALPQVTGRRDQFGYILGTAHRAGAAEQAFSKVAEWGLSHDSAWVDWANINSFEVQVLQPGEAKRLRAVVELVTPINKYRNGHRHAFAIKCAAYLQSRVAVVVIDIVTESPANLHYELAMLLGLRQELYWQCDEPTYAAAYRILHCDQTEHLDVWTTSLALGQRLPKLPLWLDSDLVVPLDLEETYETTCASMRVRP